MKLPTVLAAIAASLVVAQAPSVPTGLRLVSATTNGPAYGPQPSITCPSGAIAVPAAASLQAAVNAAPAGSTFCLKAGTHPITAPVTPKSRDTFVGEYGAILDGSTWKTTVD